MTSARDDSEPGITFYEAAGGSETFEHLVRRFYEGVANDPVLRPLYPEEDLGPAEERLRLFLIQYWGGPRTYSDRRGHPRLRMRHAPFRVGARERDRWLEHMRTAMDEVALPAKLDEQLWQYLVMAANSMINTFEESPRQQGSGSEGNDDDGESPIRISPRP